MGGFQERDRGGGRGQRSDDGRGTTRGDDGQTVGGPEEIFYKGKFIEFLQEIDEQMRAWSRVRDIEIMKDEVEEKMKVKKTVTADLKQENSDEELDEESLEEFLDWRQKKT